MMTSKTSFFNPSVLRKDLTRFAPVWALYSIALVLYNFLMFGNFNTAEDYAVFVSSYIVNLSAVSMIYAAVCALVLLGDLYVNRSVRCRNNGQMKMKICSLENWIRLLLNPV